MKSLQKPSGTQSRSIQNAYCPSSFRTAVGRTWMSRLWQGRHEDVQKSTVSIWRQPYNDPSNGGLWAKGTRNPGWGAFCSPCSPFPAARHSKLEMDDAGPHCFPRSRGRRTYFCLLVLILHQLKCGGVYRIDELRDFDGPPRARTSERKRAASAEP